MEEYWGDTSWDRDHEEEEYNRRLFEDEFDDPTVSMTEEEFQQWLKLQGDAELEREIEIKMSGTFEI